MSAAWMVSLSFSSDESKIPASATTRVYRAIKQLILVGRLMPGVQLTHEGLATELGVSRTPVREALERLLQEGFVQHRRNRGYFVADLNVDEVRELFGLRTALELYALEEAWIRGTLLPLDDLHEINQRYLEAIAEGSSKRRMLIDQEFHHLLALRSGNQLLVKALDSLFERIILKRRVGGYVVEKGFEAHQEQEKLLQLLDADDYHQARETLSHHIASGRDRLLAQLMESGTVADSTMV
ncbi:GntR family transcriptional regulator [Achromobacter anxifer]|uniref:GntR family transcriptional regulator n=1 Tax=Achromobacter anxifer TaxID=1287737 RepID=UPI0023F715B2|nr:GntR family transcriptional regulator [Achromobacter anxifer]MDF8364741.1 GntR family transcriptional regulator [Achromobacter anxifer]